MPRYWVGVAIVEAVLAAALPISGITQTRLGTLQILYAVALAALLMRLMAGARPNPARPPPGDRPGSGP